MNEMKKWEILLPTVELVINSLPNSSTGFSPFFLNYEVGISDSDSVTKER